MMYGRNLSAILIVLLLLVGCASVPTKDIEINTQADPKTNFNGYKTYGWLGSAAIVNDPKGQWEPPSFDADAEISFLIDRELCKRGMSENNINPDMIVAYAAGIDMDALELEVDPDAKMELVENVPQGGLAIVLIDRQSGFVIWLGVATAEILETPDTNTVKARLDFAVTHLFKEIP